MLAPDEHLEPLGDGLQLVVSSAHIFSTDSILLAHFAAPHRNDVICDLGTGSGILPLLWCKKQTGAITALDIQKKACEQLQKSLALNHLEHRVTVVNADLRALKEILPFGAFDLVTMNPPYFPQGSGKQSFTESDKLSRHETACTPLDAAQAAAALLRYGGRFCLCHRTERLCDVIDALRQAKIEVKRLRFVAQSEGKAPWLFLAEGKRGAKPGVRVEPQLVLQNPDGSDSAEMRRIFGNYRQT